MAEWASDKILNSWFITHGTPNGYEIHFATPDMEKYLAVQEECRRQIRHAKPMTNADRIRQMTDEELAEYLGTDLDGCVGRKCVIDDNTDCQKCWLDWLKQEVDEE